MRFPQTDQAWSKLTGRALDSLPASYPVFKGPGPQTEEFPLLFDHTYLKTDVPSAQIKTQIDRICKEAAQYHFKTVCVRPEWASFAAAALHGSGVGICCVIGFPEGTARTASKVQEATSALSAGASELDVVLNVPDLLADEYLAVYSDIVAVWEACTAPSSRSSPAADTTTQPVLKVILETSQLSSQQIVAGSLIARAAGTDYVKTSTGFLGRGASVEDVQIMRAVVDMPWPALGVDGELDAGSQKVKVKASGGVRTLADALRMVEAGADRIGASAGLAIMEEARSTAQGQAPQVTDNGIY